LIDFKNSKKIIKPKKNFILIKTEKKFFEITNDETKYTTNRINDIICKLLNFNLCIFIDKKKITRHNGKIVESIIKVSENISAKKVINR
tara:strand:- start:2782 stop:3048 length:267 start_codon:yes stop_codon:yes gene_type:complete